MIAHQMFAPLEASNPFFRTRLLHNGEDLYALIKGHQLGLPLQHGD